jgi:hypothetical protein
MQDWNVEQQKEFVKLDSLSNLIYDSVKHAEFSEAFKKLSSECMEAQQGLMELKVHAAEQMDFVRSKCVLHNLDTEVSASYLQDISTSLEQERQARTEQVSEIHNIIDVRGKAQASLNSQVAEQLRLALDTLGEDLLSETDGSLKDRLSEFWQQLLVQKDAVEEQLGVLQQSVEQEAQSRFLESGRMSLEMEQLRAQVGNALPSNQASSNPDQSDAIAVLEKNWQDLHERLEFEASSRKNAVEKLESSLSAVSLSFENFSNCFSSRVNDREEAEARSAHEASMRALTDDLKAELEKEVQVRETTLSRLAEQQGLETNAHIGTVTELRRALEDLEAKSVDQLERRFQQAQEILSKEVGKLWHALDTRMHSMQVETPGNTISTSPAGPRRQTIWTGEHKATLDHRVLVPSKPRSQTFGGTLSPGESATETIAPNASTPSTPPVTRSRSARSVTWSAAVPDGPRNSLHGPSRHPPEISQDPPVVHHTSIHQSAFPFEQKKSIQDDALQRMQRQTLSGSQLLGLADGSVVTTPVRS